MPAVQGVAFEYVEGAGDGLVVAPGGDREEPVTPVWARCRKNCWFMYTRPQGPKFWQVDA